MPLLHKLRYRYLFFLLLALPSVLQASQLQNPVATEALGQPQSKEAPMALPQTKPWRVAGGHTRAVYDVAFSPSIC